MRKEKTDIKINKVLTKAVLRSADLLDIDINTLSKIIGISTSLLLHDGVIDLKSKQGEIAVEFVRICQNLFAYFQDNHNCSLWLKSPNSHFYNEVPIVLMEKITGLVVVSDYLESVKYV